MQPAQDYDDGTVWPGQDRVGRRKTLNHMEMHQPPMSFSCWEMKLQEGSSTIYTSDTKSHLGTKLQFQLLPFSIAVVILVDLSSSPLSSFGGNILPNKMHCAVLVCQPAGYSCL